LPIFEGIFSRLEDLAKKLKRPVFGLNWTRDMSELKTMKEISAYYRNLLKKLSPNGNYDIVGYSFGGFILSKMFRKTPIGKAVIIDTLSQNIINNETDNDEEIFQIMYQVMCQDMPEVFKERISKVMKSAKNSDELIKKSIAELKEFGGKSLVDKDMDLIFENTVERARMLLNYRRKLTNKLKVFAMNTSKKYLQINGKLLIITPTKGSNDHHFNDKVYESYYLPKQVKHFESLFSL
jgi:thioesterase domain-containing protein